MNKSLLTLVVAGTLPLGAHAQTKLTLYGLADAGVGYVKTDGLLAPATGTRSSGGFQTLSSVQSSSRWGVRGSEDLGGGLSAVFNLEAGYNVDDGSGKIPGGMLFNRRSTIGLQGAFGQVYVGRDYTPMLYTGSANDIGGLGMWGNTLGYFNAGFATIRYSNAVFYNTPIWDGLQVRTVIGNTTIVGTEYDTAPKSRDRNVEVGVYYAAGAITANIAGRYGNNNDLSLTGDLRRVRQFTAGGGYNFGAFRLVGMIGGSWPDRDENSLIGTAPSAVNANAQNVIGGQYAQNNRALMASLGIGVRLGAGELLMQAWQLRMDAPMATLLNANGSKPKASFAMLAYTYPLSKRTNLYGSYGRGNNTNGANIMLIGADTSATTTALSSQTNNVNSNASQQALSLGMRHLF